jgi:hypothetical protein
LHSKQAWIMNQSSRMKAEVYSLSFK